MKTEKATMTLTMSKDTIHIVLYASMPPYANKNEITKQHFYKGQDLRIYCIDCANENRKLQISGGLASKQ